MNWREKKEKRMEMRRGCTGQAGNERKGGGRWLVGKKKKRKNKKK
jgi:hypothetical protein